MPALVTAQRLIAFLFRLHDAAIDLLIADWHCFLALTQNFDIAKALTKGDLVGVGNVLVGKHQRPMRVEGRLDRDPVGGANFSKVYVGDPSAKRRV